MSLVGQGAVTGHKCKLYLNNGTPSAETWLEVAEVSDVNIPDLNMSLAELARRANKFKKTLPSLIEVMAVEFTLIHGLDKTIFDIIRTDFFDGLPREWLVANGDITSGTYTAEGLRLPSNVNNFPWNQPLEDIVGHDIRLACGLMYDSGVEVDPAWFIAS